MTTRLIPVTLALLTGCGSTTPAPMTAPAPGPAATAGAEAPSTGGGGESAGAGAITNAPPPAPRKPEIGAWGFDLPGMDTAVAAGDNFYAHANGNWLKTTQIPEIGRASCRESG